MPKQKVCPYCKKPFLPGETLTSNENEDVVHLDCEMEFENYIDFGDYCRKTVGIQCQYGSFYLTGVAGYPNLGMGLRYIGDAGDYHSIRIHKDDAEIFRKRMEDHRREINA